MPRPVLFVDDGGVLSDNSRRGPQWQQLVAEFFPPLLGGEPAAWAAANRTVAAGFSDAYFGRLWQQAGGDFAAYVRLDRLQWLQRMCALVGVPLPTPKQCIDLAGRAVAYVQPRVRAEFPGAATAVRRLHAMGYTLHTASGESSRDLENYLGSMGVTGCFGKLFGPDLVGTLKLGPEFYARIFADAGVAPAEALVIDDRPQAAEWVLQAGGRAVLVGAAAGPAGVPCIAALAQLPDLLARPGTA